MVSVAPVVSIEKKKRQTAVSVRNSHFRLYSYQNVYLLLSPFQDCFREIIAVELQMEMTFC